MQEADTFFHWQGPNLVLNVLGHGGAKKMMIGKPRGNQLKINVTAAAEKGRATEQMITFIASSFGVKNNDIELIFGKTSKSKQFLIKLPQKIPQSLEKYGLHIDYKV